MVSGPVGNCAEDIVRYGTNKNVRSVACYGIIVVANLLFVAQNANRISACLRKE